ncbi:hypothetical protein ACFSQE_09930 [Vogesella fluminis]
MVAIRFGAHGGIEPGAYEAAIHSSLALREVKAGSRLPVSPQWA